MASSVSMLNLSDVSDVINDSRRTLRLVRVLIIESTLSAYWVHFCERYSAFAIHASAITFTLTVLILRLAFDINTTSLSVSNRQVGNSCL